MLEEEHKGDLEDSWKERISDIMPPVNRADVDSSEVCLEAVCDIGHAHLERTHQAAEGSHEMVMSLAETF